MARFNVVGEDVKADLDSDIFELSHLEVALPHPVFERAENIFNGSSPHTHGAGDAV